MVRARPDDDGINAFAIDENDNMDALLEEAASAGSAAVDELDNELFKSDLLPNEPEEQARPAVDIDFGIHETPVSAPVTAPVQQQDPTPVVAPAVVAPEPVLQDVGDEIDALLETLNVPVVTEVEDDEPVFTQPDFQTETAVTAPTPLTQATEPTPAYTEPTPVPAVQAAPVVTPPVPVTPAVQTGMTTEDKIALARKVVATVDAYRSLSTEAKDVVGQLLAPTSEEFSQDEGTVAIRAIYAEPIQESTQKALIEAKNASPVDRVFYVLGLPKDVLSYLGELVQAYSRTAIPEGLSELQFAKVLVDTIEQLTEEPIIYAEAMAKVLTAAQS